MTDSISGRLDLHSGPGAWGALRSCATNSMFLEADGKHYVVAAAFFDDITVGEAESKAIIGTVTSARWQTDLAGTGVTAGLAGAFTMSKAAYPAAGTDKFIVLGYQIGGAGTSLPSNDEGFVVGVRYKIEAGAIVVDDDGAGGFLYRAETPPGGIPHSNNSGTPYGAIVKGDYLYAVMYVIKMLRSTDGDRDLFVKLPLTGTIIENVPGSWTPNTQFLSTTKASDDFITGYYFGATGYVNLGTNNAAILPMPGGVFRVLSYLRQYAIDSALYAGADWHGIDTTGCEYWDVNLGARSNDPILQTDGRSLFDQPWSDAGRNYAGDISGAVEDDYFAPNVQAVEGGHEITFCRLFEDEPDILRCRTYFCDLSGNISFVGIFECEITGDRTPSHQYFGMAYRIDDDTVVYAISNSQTWDFGEKSQTRPDACAFATGFTDADIQAVEPACDIDWPFDELKPRHIKIVPVHATIGGGPALTGNEDVEGAEDEAAFSEGSGGSGDSGGDSSGSESSGSDGANSGSASSGASEGAAHAVAGFWRLTLGNIPIRTLHQVRKWREIQTSLNGRIGVCCVHIYDGKRAPWPVPLAAISVQAASSAEVGDTSLDVQVNSGSALQVGMHFSAAARLYRIVAIGAPSSDPPVYPLTIWPPVRTAIGLDDELEFAHPICRMRLASDGAMNIPLELLRYAEPSVDLVEDI